MFNKALFKQSCKANGVMWSIITAAVCFMLACVMLISGSGQIGEVVTGVEDTIVQEQIETTVKKQINNDYVLIDDAMSIFDEAFVKEIKSNFLTRFVESGDAVTAYTQTCTTDASVVYTKAILTFGTDLESYTTQIDKSYISSSDFCKQLYSLSMFAINPNGQANDTYEAYESGSSSKVEDGYDVSSLFTTCQLDLASWVLGNEGENIANYLNSEERVNYRHSLITYSLPIVISANFVSEENVTKMLLALAEFGVSEEKYNSYGYTYTKVKGICSSSVVTLDARLNLEYSSLNRSDYTSEEEYIEAKNKIKQDVITDISASFIDKLPSEVSDALYEIGKVDLYSLIVGSIFFKMAGLLLPIIYMIMASNNLIATQVDTGSMAYVLSTSTKRKEVTFTQGLFLIASLFAMFLCTTITSVICFACVNIPTTSLTYGKLILMNLGAFLVLFSMAGINFFTSCVFDRSKRSMAIGGGLSMFFLVCTMLGLFGSPVIPSIVRLSALNVFNYTSIISFFDVISIIDGTATFIWKLAILLGIGAVGFISGSYIFKKKDLPL